MATGIAGNNESAGTMTGAGSQLQCSADGWILSGEMSYATVTGLKQLGDRVWKVAAPAWIDMRQVTRIDSAGVVLLLSWLRKAKSDGGRLSFRSMPSQLSHLVDFYGIGNMFSQDVGDDSQDVVNGQGNG